MPNALHARTRSAVQHHWAHVLGVDVLKLGGKRKVVPHHSSGALAHYAGVYVWSSADHGSVISCPPGWEAAIERITTEVATATMLAGDFWHGSLGAACAQVIGPAFQAEVDGQTFQPTVLGPCRALTAEDQPALARLRAACTPLEWQHSTIDPSDMARIVGFMEVKDMLAAASAKASGDLLASIGVLTHPAHRGRGAGRAVISALVRQLLNEEQVPHYQTLHSNVPAVAAALRLGFVQTASTLSIRLHETVPEVGRNA